MSEIPIELIPIIFVGLWLLISGAMYLGWKIAEWRDKR